MFITLEGIEGAGKGTVLERMCQWFEKNNKPFLVTREPGGSALGRTLRSLLLDIRQHVVPEAELFLYLADRAQHVREVIMPALAEGTVVISDRYADSTIVYQGGGRGLAMEHVVQMNEVAVGGLWPDATFLLDLPPEVGLARALARNTELGIAEAEGKFEAESLAFHQRIREGYLARAASYPQRFHIIDAVASPDAVFASVEHILSQRIFPTSR